MNQAAQAVRAKEHAVTTTQLDEGEIDGDLLGCAERLQDDVGVLEGFRFVFGELPRLDELIHQ